MVAQPGFFDLEERLAGLSAKGDELERLNAVVDFELFRPELERAVPRADRSKGGRPPFDHVLMFKVLILQTQNSLRTSAPSSTCATGCRACAFSGSGLADPVPDANTIWTFREALTRWPARSRPVRALRPGADAGQATWRCAARSSMPPSSRRPSSATRKAEKQATSRRGASRTGGRTSRPSSRQKDRDARWTVK